MWTRQAPSEPGHYGYRFNEVSGVFVVEVGSHGTCIHPISRFHALIEDLKGWWWPTPLDLPWEKRRTSVQDIDEAAQERAAIAVLKAWEGHLASLKEMDEPIHDPALVPEENE